MPENLMATETPDELGRREPGAELAWRDHGGADRAAEVRDDGSDACIVLGYN